MPFRSKLGNVFTSILFNVVFGRKIVDTQSGFRVLSLGFARELVEKIRPGGYETEMRMLIHAVKSQRAIHEITIETIYLDENSNSKFRPLQDSMRVLSVFSRYTVVAFSSFVLDYTLFLALAYTLQIHYLYAHTAARICSGCCNFFANRHLVFKSEKNAGPEVLRYCATVVFSLSLSALLLYLFVDRLGVSQAIAKPVAEFVLFLLNFIVLNKLVFKREKD
jgi:putative flippase GtrA